MQGTALENSCTDSDKEGNHIPSLNTELLQGIGSCNKLVFPQILFWATFCPILLCVLL
jgi:hypothetical protein